MNRQTDFIKVGVFPHQKKRSVTYAAYTYWYNPHWEGCCEHLVPIEMRRDAKKIAIAEHKARCVPDDLIDTLRAKAKAGCGG